MGSPHRSGSHWGARRYPSTMRREILFVVRPSPCDLRASRTARSARRWAYLKGSLSLWLRDVPLTEEQQRSLALRGRAATTARAEAIRANAARRRSFIRAQARDQIRELSESELFVAGVVAYWAEGSKNKPWRFGQGVVLVNSDPGLIRMFLRWLAVVGIEAERLQFRLQIHESADVSASLEYWADVVGAPTEVFRSTTLKTHNPKTVRRTSVRRTTDALWSPSGAVPI